MTHENIPTTNEIFRGPLKGSDFPSKIVQFSDGSNQIVWSTTGSTVAFDEVTDGPHMADVHKAMVYRLAGSTEVTDVSFTGEAVVVAKKPSYQAEPTSVRVYSREGIDRNYDIPKTVTIGEPVSLLSGLCSGKLTAVCEVINAPIDGSSTSNFPEHVLNGFKGLRGQVYSNIPRIDREGVGKHLQLLNESEARLSRAVARVGLIAVQTNGVVTR